MRDGWWEAFLRSVGRVFVFVGSAAAAGLLCDLGEVTPYILPSISQLAACQEDGRHQMGSRQQPPQAQRHGDRNSGVQQPLKPLS